MLFGAAGVANAAGNQSWDGVYGGIQGDWGFDGKAKLKFPPDAGSLVFAPLLSGGKVNTSPEGGAWGLHLGENRQFGNWVIGLEGSFNWADIDDSNGNAFGTAIPTPTKHKTSLNWFGALTPRVGYAIGNWLPYVKAGLAIAEYENYFTAANGMRFKRGHIHNGWTAGLGVEYALAPAWVLGVEYNYSNFNSRTYGGQGVPDNTWATQYGLSPSSHAVMARLSYNFGAQPKNSGGSSGANVDLGYA